MGLNLQSNSKIEALLSMMIRVGVISAVYPERHSARVVFPEDGNNTSYELKVLCRNSLKNRDYQMPDLGEDALCLFLSEGIEDGFILGSFYTGEVTPPSANQDERKVEFSDGAYVVYNRQSNTLDVVIGDTKIHATKSTINAETSSAITAKASSITIEGGSSVTVIAPQVTIQAPQTEITGNVVIGGALSQGTGSGGGNATFAGSVQAQGDVTAGNISLTGHIHTAPHGDTTPPK